MPPKKRDKEVLKDSTMKQADAVKPAHEVNIKTEVVVSGKRTSNNKKRDKAARSSDMALHPAGEVKGAPSTPVKAGSTQLMTSHVPTTAVNLTATAISAAPNPISAATKTASEVPGAVSTTLEYDSPLKKLKKTMNAHPQKIIDTIEGLRAYIKSNDVTDPEVRSKVRIKARLLWTTAETVKGLHSLRLYMGETHATEPLELQQKEYQEAQCRDPFNANQYLITTSLYEVDAKDTRLPNPGDVVMFTPAKMRLYRNCCQVDTKLQSMFVVKPPAPLKQ